MNEELNGNDLNGSIDAQESADVEVEEVDYDAHPPEDDSRLIELVGFLVQGVVAHPDEVEVEEFFDDIGTVYGVRVHSDDVGRIIGKDGRIANALRQVVKAAATKAGTHVMVEILTDDAPLPLVDSSDDSEADTETSEDAS
jgi:predicted RNA-binding protein YlqC (UPF0109 family)